MATYLRVGEKPEKLKDGECVITKPDFSEEIEANRARRGTSGLTSVRNLRDVFMTITDKYDHSVNPYQLKLSKYEGIEYKSDAGFRDVLFKVIKDFDLDLLEKAVEHQIRNRPRGADYIYYVSPDMEGTGAFIRNGINMDTDGNKNHGGKKKPTKKQEVKE